MTVSDQIRQLINRSGITWYRLAKLSGVELSSISRFMNKERSLTTTSIDKLGKVLGFEITTNPIRVAVSYQGTI